MQPIIHTANKQTFLLVEVPDGQQSNKPYTQHFPRAGSWLAFESDNLNDFKTQLPEGQWGIIGKASQLSEEQIDLVCERDPVLVDVYINHLKEAISFCAFPEQAIRNLCESLNINPNECLILKEK